MDIDFSDSRFIRSGGSVSFQERGAQPADFTRKRGYVYAYIYAESPTVFPLNYPNWQPFADCFTVRRPVIVITGRQTCHTKSFKASDLGDFTDPGFVKIKNFRIPGLDRGSIPPGKYQLVNLSFSDNGDSNTEVTVQYQQYGEWQLIPLVEKEKMPSPK